MSCRLRLEQSRLQQQGWGFATHVPLPGAVGTKKSKVSQQGKQRLD